MKHLALLVVPTIALATPALSAGLYYRDSSGVVVDQPAPVVQRERIIERYYYAPPAPVVSDRVVIQQPRVYYAPRSYYAPRGYSSARYGYAPSYYDDGPRWRYYGPRWNRPYRW